MLGLNTRTVVQEKCVSNALDAAEFQDGRIGEVYRGLEWVVCRAPEKGVKVPGTDKPVYLMKVEPNKRAKSKGITILYSYDNNSVNILDIRIFG